MAALWAGAYGEDCWNRKWQFLPRVITTNLLGEANSQLVLNTTLTHLWFSKNARFPTVSKSDKYALAIQNPHGDPSTAIWVWSRFRAANPACPRPLPNPPLSQTPWVPLKPRECTAESHLECSFKYPLEWVWRIDSKTWTWLFPKVKKKKIHVFFLLQIMTLANSWFSQNWHLSHWPRFKLS